MINNKLKAGTQNQMQSRADNYNIICIAVNKDSWQFTCSLLVEIHLSGESFVVGNLVASKLKDLRSPSKLS